MCTVYIRMNKNIVIICLKIFHWAICKSRDGEPLKVVLEMMSLKGRKEDIEGQ